jgi:hypothetical protein
MEEIKQNNKQQFVNLFAEFILSKFNPIHKTIINVVDFDNFIVVYGVTSSDNNVNIDEVKQEFLNNYLDVITGLGYTDNINVISIIKLSTNDVPVFNNVWFNITKLNNKFLTDVKQITYSSSFPYGYSLNVGRDKYYYSKYIFNHLYNFMGVDELEFYFTDILNNDDDLDINIKSNTKLNIIKLKSLILDVFNFDLVEFNKKLENYNLIEDITNPYGNKPYQIQDKLNDLVVF